MPRSNAMNKICTFQWEVGQMWKSNEEYFQKSAQEKTSMKKDTNSSWYR